MINKENWQLPVSFDREGKVISLREYVARRDGRVAFSALSEAQRIQLAVKRIELQPAFVINGINAGLVDRKRALNEIQRKTELGRAILDIEICCMTHLVNEASKQG